MENDLSRMDRDVYLVQNPSISAASIWRFVVGHFSETNKGVPFPLAFVILPIVFREDVRETINGTNKKSSLQKISEKLFKSEGKYRNDLLYYVNDAAVQYRDMTLAAIGIAVDAKLIALDASTALLTPLTQTEKKNLPQTAKSLLSAADKLGYWCSQISLHEISKILKVRF